MIKYHSEKHPIGKESLDKDWGWGRCYLCGWHAGTKNDMTDIYPPVVNKRSVEKGLGEGGESRCDPPEGLHF